MKNFKKFLWWLVAVSAISGLMILSACDTPDVGGEDEKEETTDEGDNTGGDSEGDSGGSDATAFSSVSDVLGFNVSDSKAVAGGANVNKSRADGEEVVQDYGLVKIKSDGTIDSAIEFPNDKEGVWADSMPPIAFISLGDDGSVYVCFQHPYGMYWWEAITNESTNTASRADEDEESKDEEDVDDKEEKVDVTYKEHRAFIQFVRIYTNNSYQVLWPLDPEDYDHERTGQVSTWSWKGVESDPLVRDPNGILYFKVSTWTAGRSEDVIYQYDPDTSEDPSPKTPSGAGLEIENFTVDAQGHLFVKNPNHGGGFGSGGNYMKVYYPGQIAPKNVYYDSLGSTWVRGYIQHPSGSNLIMNGFNIRDMNGIIRVNLSDFSNDLTYDHLYKNSDRWNTWSRVELKEPFGGGWGEGPASYLIEDVTNEWINWRGILNENEWDMNADWRFLKTVWASNVSSPTALTTNEYTYIYTNRLWINKDDPQDRVVTELISNAQVTVYKVYDRWHDGDGDGADDQWDNYTVKNTTNVIAGITNIVVYTNNSQSQSNYFVDAASPDGYYVYDSILTNVAYTNVTDGGSNTNIVRYKNSAYSDDFSDDDYIGKIGYIEYTDTLVSNLSVSNVVTNISATMTNFETNYNTTNIISSNEVVKVLEKSDSDEWAVREAFFNGLNRYWNDESWDWGKFKFDSISNINLINYQFTEDSGTIATISTYSHTNETPLSVTNISNVTTVTNYFTDQWGNGDWTNAYQMLVSETAWYDREIRNVYTQTVKFIYPALDMNKVVDMLEKAYFLGEADLRTGDSNWGTNLFVSVRTITNIVTTNILPETNYELISELNTNEYDNINWMGYLLDEWESGMENKEFLTNNFSGDLVKEWLLANGIDSFNFENIGKMLWTSDGALYGLYDSSWWGGGQAPKTMVLQLLETNGNKKLKVVELQKGERFPTKLKVNGDYLYYRYSLFDSQGQETGYHKLSRMNVKTETEELLMESVTGLPGTLEILSYDVSPDDTILFIGAIDNSQNKFVSYEIDLTTDTATEIDVGMRLSSIKVIE